MTAWPKYRSHKIVEALPIIAVEEIDGERVLYVEPVEGHGEAFKPTQEGMEKRVGVGDYAMRYPDGFQSVSPRAAFEEGYKAE